MRNTLRPTPTTRLLRVLVVASLCMVHAANVLAIPHPPVNEPIIRLSAPKLVGDSIVTVSSGPVRVAGRALSPFGMVAVHVGNRTTGAQVVARMDGNGEFVADLPVQAGRNDVLIMALDKKDGRGMRAFTIVLPGAPVVAAPVRKDPVDPGTGSTTGGTTHDPVDQPTRGTVEPTTGGTGERGTMSREQLLGAQQTVPTTTSTTTSGASARKVYALVVGISKYENAPSIQLRYSATDARAFADHLQGPQGFMVPEGQLVRLLDRAATRDRIELELKRLASAAGPNDLLIFYFSGHGVNDGDDNLCLLGYDVRNEDDDSRWATGVKQSSILEAMRSSRCRNRLLVLDACQSGLMRAGGSDAGEQATVAVSKLTDGDDGLLVLTSSSAGESSYEVEDLNGGYGIFTHYLLKGAKGEADGSGREGKDGIVDLWELRHYLPEKVNSTAVRVSGKGQNPVCDCAGGDDLPLGRSAAMDAAVSTPNGAGTSTSGGDGTRVADQEKPRYGFIPLPEDPKKLEGVVFVNEQTGDQVSFYNVNLPNAWVSARIKGEVFLCVAVQQGKTFVFQDRDRKNELVSGAFDMNPEWDRMTVRIDYVNDTVSGRTLRRIGVPQRASLVDAMVFADEEQDNHLEVVRPQPTWTFISGNLGDRIVDYAAEKHGDLLILKDESPPGRSWGRALWNPEWNTLAGKVLFEDSTEVSFTLALAPPAGKRDLEERTYADEYYPDQDITFYNTHPEHVELRGTVGPGPVKCFCERRGDVFRCRDNSGTNTLEPFRLLLKKKGQRLVGKVFLVDKGTVIVNMARVY